MAAGLAAPGQTTRSVDVLRKTNGSVQNISGGATVLQFPTTVLNTAGVAASAADVLGVAWQDGLYEIHTGLTVNVQVGGTVMGELLVNGVLYEGFWDRAIENGRWQGLDVSSLAQLDAGDQVAIRISVDSGNGFLNVSIDGWNKGELKRFNDIAAAVLVPTLSEWGAIVGAGGQSPPINV